MDLASWLIEYKKISATLPLKFSYDLEAARLLDRMTRRDDSTALRRISHKPVLIFANTQYLKEDLKILRKLKRKPLIIAVDGAVRIFLQEKIIPQINVTDLDGDPESIVKANELGSITVVHAHGDNIGKIKKLMPLLEGRTVCTTQTRPFGHLHNYYGFTDGDRAVFLAEYFKASKIGLFSFRFYRSESMKAQKLQVGKYLIEKCSHEYNNVFDLGARRSNLAIPTVSLLEFEKLRKNE